MKLTIKQKIKVNSLKNLIIQHPDYLHALETIEEAYLLKDQGDLPQSFLCIGQSGTGKSTLKSTMSKLYPRKSDGEREIIPILTLDTPSQPTIKGFAEEMLIHLGDPLPHKGTQINMTNRILKLIKSCGVKLMIFDELQHFIENRKDPSKPSDVADWFKTLIEKSKVSVVLMGLERSHQIIDSNEQLRRRFSKTIDLRPFDLFDNNTRNSFLGILRKLDEEVGLPTRIDLTDKSLVKSIYFATNGIIDYMVKLFIGAYEVALLNGENCLSKNCFKSAFVNRIWNKGLGKLNPFEDDFVQERLDKVGMPFHLSKNAYSERISL